MYYIVTTGLWVSLTFRGSHDGDAVILLVLLFLLLLLHVVLPGCLTGWQVIRGLQRSAADGQLEQALGQSVVLHGGQEGLHTL